MIAYRSLGTWRADGAFGAWLSRIAIRLAVRRAQARKQVTWLDPLAAEADQPGRDRFRTMDAGDAVDPAHSVLRSERDAQVRAAVASLDEPYREVVALRFFAERSLAEIAEATDRPLGTREDPPPPGPGAPAPGARRGRPMTGDRPNGRPRPFRPDELDGVTGIRPDELAAEARVARDLEGASARGGVEAVGRLHRPGHGRRGRRARAGAGHRRRAAPCDAGPPSASSCPSATRSGWRSAVASRSRPGPRPWRSSWW